MLSRMRKRHCAHGSRWEPVTVTIRSLVTVEMEVAYPASIVSLGESLTDETPVDSSRNLMLEPDLPMIMPQLVLGTSSRTIKSKLGLPSPGAFCICQDMCWRYCCSCSAHSRSSSSRRATLTFSVSPCTRQTRSCVPGKKSPDWLSFILVRDCPWSSDMV